MLPALALGAEKPDPGVMKRPPRARGERLLSWGMLARAYLFLGVLEATAAMLAFFFVLMPPAGSTGSFSTAPTLSIYRRLQPAWQPLSSCRWSISISAATRAARP
jgi:magnesium-transporting ATPase (P-type)